MYSSEICPCCVFITWGLGGVGGGGWGGSYSVQVSSELHIHFFNSNIKLFNPNTSLL